MVGHYLLTLTPEQEDRVLTGKMAPGGARMCGTNCLMEVAEGTSLAWLVWYFNRPLTWSAPHVQYDRLCGRFGPERINAAIRNRIISNQARRELARTRELAHV